MFVITFLQFVTAATGVAACIAIIRGLAGNRLTQLGNFYVDLHARDGPRVPAAGAAGRRSILMWQGTPMTFEGAAQGDDRRGRRSRRSPAACRAGVVAIKQLGTNGGGYFGPNSAHPYENPTPLSNFVETWSITIIPMAMVWTLGYMVGRRRLAVVIFATMLALYLPMVDRSASRRRPAATRRSPRWASTSPPARWRARRSASAPGCRRSGR